MAMRKYFSAEGKQETLPEWGRLTYLAHWVANQYTYYSYSHLQQVFMCPPIIWEMFIGSGSNIISLTCPYFEANSATQSQDKKQAKQE